MGLHMPGRCVALALALALMAALAARPPDAEAGHESTNELVFEPISGSETSPASGHGVIDYRGGSGPDSRWTIQLQFVGLAPDSTYVVALQGRYGEPDTPEAEVFTQLCVVQTSPSGDGGCWWYLLGMRRIDVVQLRLGTVDGPPVVQATRKGDGPDSITSVPNEFSPPPSSPVASPIVPSPVASPTIG